jgi:hypothetical protein
LQPTADSAKIRDRVSRRSLMTLRNLDVVILNEDQPAHKLKRGDL